MLQSVGQLVTGRAEHALSAPTTCREGTCGNFDLQFAAGCSANVDVGNVVKCDPGRVKRHHELFLVERLVAAFLVGFLCGGARAGLGRDL